ncbi:hypothetical protein [Microbacterium sp. JZ31]|uniref:hypothetical protein n=1 Tax=Microbacterium sp. JZ31 TaxID=1906274 RepID=UPI001932EC7A|nr:hypothetical protein [Microbacterium sp. JZ31]
MTFTPAQPAERRPDGPNVLAVVALALAALVAAGGALSSYLPMLVDRLPLPISSLATVIGVGSLILMLVGAACAIIGLRHPRKLLAAIALGYFVVTLIQTALWSGVLPVLVRVYTG